uniref:Ribonuclease H-like domain-containing protein n=1 Tax=Tanacetum cinerariifolium TaxID=118510 RepID=A0A6L2J9W3_TANCI|nr:ribonuclease H-like domain-containing protein [Tanacetum cinerariifolium]
MLGALKFSYICFRRVLCVFFVASLPPNLALVTRPRIVEVEVPSAFAIVQGNPLHLQTSDFNSNTIISVKLTGTKNYRVWAADMKLAINTRNKTGFLDGTCLKSTHANSASLSISGKDAILLCCLGCLILFLKNYFLVKFSLIMLLSLLARETLPDVKDAFVIISREESHRGITSSSSGSVTKPRVGHIVNRGFDIIGYPLGYNKNSGPKSNGPRTFNANSVSSSFEKGASLSFTNEQMIKLMNLINEAPSRNVQANMKELNIPSEISDSNVNDLKFFDEKHYDFQSPSSPNDDERVFQAPNDEGSAQPCSSSADDSEVDLAASMGNDSSSEGSVPSNSCPLSQSDFPGNSSQGLPDLRRSSRTMRQPARLNDYVVNKSKKYGLEKYVTFSRLNSINYCFSTTLNKSTEPTTYSEAIKNPNWIEAMNNEIEALNRNDTWIICDLLARRKAVSSKWLWKIKYKSTGEIERYKARVISKGFSQREGFDYLEIFTPVVKMSTVRYLTEDVYMTLPLGFDNDKSKSKYDYSLFTKKSDNVFIMLLVYVDDIVITGNDMSKTDKFKMVLKSKFQIKDLGKLKYFLGIEVLDNKDGICLSQRKYCLELLHEYGLLAGKPMETPITENTTMDHIESNDDPLLSNIGNYQRLVGKLIYLTNTRLGIAYVVYCLSQFMYSSLNSHLDAAMRVLRYLKSSIGNGIQINRNGNLKLRAYADSDCARCLATRKYVSGYYVFFGD